MIKIGHLKTAGCNGHVMPSAGCEAEAAAEAEARLLALCRQLVSEAARDAWARPPPGGRSSGGGGGAALAAEGYSWDQVRSLGWGW